MQRGAHRLSSHLSYSGGDIFSGVIPAEVGVVEINRRFSGRTPTGLAHRDEGLLQRGAAVGVAIAPTERFGCIESIDPVGAIRIARPLGRGHLLAR